MGCCFSTPNSNQHQNDLKTHLRSPQPQAPPKSNSTHEAEHIAPPPPPPPPPVEEESVKEVLSETPIISKPQVSFLMAETKIQMPELQHRKGTILNKAEEEEVSEEVSQITETCSISESFSTTTTATTTTVTEKRDDEATSKRSTREGPRNRNRAHLKRSYAVERNRIGGRGRRPKSPAKETDPPTEKRIPVSSWSARRTDSGQVRRDPGERYGRRSRSPAASRTLTAADGRSHIKPPGGGGRRNPPSVKRLVERGDGGDEKIGVGNDVVPQEESLENPHVSLECFIFL